MMLMTLFSSCDIGISVFSNEYPILHNLLLYLYGRKTVVYVKLKFCVTICVAVCTAVFPSVCLSVCLCV